MQRQHERYRQLQLCGLLMTVLLWGCATDPVAETAPTSPPPSPSPEAAPEPQRTDLPQRPEEPTTTSPEVPLTVKAGEPVTEAALWEKLQQPQDTLYVVLLRHALAPGTGDPDNFQLDDCTTQRNLSDEGRSQAERIGQTFRDRGVDVSQVLSSQWCRCLETAERMNLGEVVPFPPLNSFFRDRSTAEAQTTAVHEHLAAQAETPGVIVMVTHQVNITALTDYVPRSGEAVIMQVDEQNLILHGPLQPE